MGEQKLPTLDLHGFKKQEALDAVDRFLMDQGRNKAPRVRIMTGKGTGELRRAVIEYLKMGKYPWQYEKSDRGKINEGILLVFLD